MADSENTRGCRMDHAGSKTTRRQVMNALGVGALSLAPGTVGCSEEDIKLLLKLIELLKESFGLNEEVSGTVQFDRRAKGDTDVGITIVIRGPDGTEQARKPVVVRVQSDNDEGSWEGPKPVRRGQHTVDATADGQTVTSDPFEVT